MSNRTTLAQMREMDAKGVAGLPTDHLMLLLEDVAALKADTKWLDDRLRDALVMRFGPPAADARRAAGKDTGKVWLNDGEHRIGFDLPKKVTWDQDKLWAAVERLEGIGEDPGEYIDRKLSVREAAFSNWPNSLRAMVEDARTLDTGKPTIVIERRRA